MPTDQGTKITEILKGREYQQRLEKARRFEQVEGGGLAKQIERLITDPTIYVPYVFYAKTGMSRSLLTAVTLFWGRKIRMPLDDYDALILYMYGGLHGDEMKYTKFLAKHLGKEDVFYDIGANRGFYAFLAADLCQEIHTFEAVPELARIVTVNIRPEDNITVNACAVSDTDGTVDFYLMDSTMTNTMQSTVAELLSSHEHPVSRKVSVPSVTLDTYMKTHTPPTFLKIDVEGAEEQVLEGGKQFFVTHSPTIAMEIWGKQNKWELSMSAAQKLRNMGYRSYSLNDEGEASEVMGDLSEHVSPQGGENFIFKK